MSRFNPVPDPLRQIGRHGVGVEYLKSLQPGVNLYNLATNTDGIKTWPQNGSTSADATFTTSDFIPVDSNTQYTQNMSGNEDIIFYDYNKNFISGLTGTFNTFTTPANCYYLKSSLRPVGDKNYYQLQKGAVSTTLVPFKSLLIPNDQLQSSQYGTVWGSLGDSITAAGLYQTKVANIISQRIINYGIAGSTIAAGASGSNPMCTRYNTIDSTCNLITVFGGTNDFGQSIALGTLTTGTYDTSTFYGALQTLIEGLLSTYPNARIVFITPTQRSTGKTANGVALLMSDYVTAIKNACANYNIPIVDVFADSGINVLNINTFTSDGTHPNDAGHTRIANLIISKFRGI